MGTRESQRDSKEIIDEGLDFIVNVARPAVDQPSRHPDWIINMDQTPVCFSMQDKRTLDVLGKKTINIRKSKGDTKRCTHAAMITASGKTLTPHIVFEGTSHGRIAKKELPKLDKSMRCATQRKAWMDEVCMLDWVDVVLMPCLPSAPEWVRPVLFLDAHRCHMMKSVVASIEDLGCEVIHVPPGSTCVAQPVDVGCNKPVKHHIRDNFEAWPLADLIANGNVTHPTRVDVAGWIKAAVDNVSAQSIVNAWRFKDFACFIPTVPERPAGHATPHCEDVENLVSGFQNVENDGNQGADLDIELTHEQFLASIQMVRVFFLGGDRITALVIAATISADATPQHR